MGVLDGLKKCDCGRAGCEYFAAGEDEWGTSYSREELEIIRDKINSVLEAEEHASTRE